jgi:hypothetical protein
MKWKLWLGRIFVHNLSPQELVEFDMNIWPHVWKQIPSDQRVDFLKNMAQEHLGTFLQDLSRNERTTLMNDLLPLAACEFPLADLDFLTAFESPGIRYQPEISDL